MSISILGSGPGLSKYDIGSDPGLQELQRLLNERAYGTSPSAAEDLLRQGLGAQIAGAKSAVASSRGVNPGAALRTSQERQGEARQGYTELLPILRAQEQANAQQMLADYLANKDALRQQQEEFNITGHTNDQLAGTIAKGLGAMYGGFTQIPQGFNGPIPDDSRLWEMNF